jgi:hypothetical protein
MLRKIASLSVVISLVVSSLNVSAQESVLPVPTTSASVDPAQGAVISPLRKGQRAPFTGVLLSPEAAARVIVNQQMVPQQIAIEVDRAKQTCQAEADKKYADLDATCKSDRDVANAKLKAAAAENAKLLKLSQDYEKKLNSQISPGVWIGLGIVGGVVATLGTVYVVTRVTN